MNSKEATKVLGVDKRNIKKAFKRQLLLDTSSSTFWIDYKRVKHSDFLSKHFQQLVINWWTIETIVSPNYKDIVRLRISNEVI
jgi:hypothetical protein